MKFRENKIILSALLISVIGVTGVFAVDQQITNVQEAAKYNALQSVEDRRITDNQDLDHIQSTFDKAYDANTGTEAQKIAAGKAAVNAADPLKTKSITGSSYVNDYWWSMDNGHGINFDPATIAPGQYRQASYVQSLFASYFTSKAFADAAWIYFDQAKIGSDNVYFNINPSKTQMPKNYSTSRHFMQSASPSSTGIFWAEYRKNFSDTTDWDGGQGATYNPTRYINGVKNTSTVRSYYDWTDTTRPAFNVGKNEISITGLKPETTYAIFFQFPTYSGSDTSIANQSKLYYLGHMIVFTTSSPIRPVKLADTSAKFTVENPIPGKLEISVPDLLLKPYYLTTTDSLYDSPANIKSAKIINTTASNKTVDLTAATHWASGTTMVGDAGTYFTSENGEVTADEPEIQMDGSGNPVLYESEGSEQGTIYKVDGDTALVNWDELGIQADHTYATGDLKFEITYDGQYGIEDGGATYTQIKDAKQDFDIQGFTTVKDYSNEPTFTNNGWTVDHQSAETTVTLTDNTEAHKEIFTADSVELFTSDTTITDKFQIIEAPTNSDGRYVAGKYKIKYTGFTKDSGELIPDIQMQFHNTATESHETTYDLVNTAGTTLDLQPSDELTIKYADQESVSYHDATFDIGLGMPSHNPKFYDPSEIKLYAKDASDNQFKVEMTNSDGTPYTDGNTEMTLKITGDQDGKPLIVNTTYNLDVYATYYDGYETQTTAITPITFTTKDNEAAQPPIISNVTATPGNTVLYDPDNNPDTDNPVPSVIGLYYDITLPPVTANTYPPTIERVYLTGEGIAGEHEMDTWTTGNLAVFDETSPNWHSETQTWNEKEWIANENMSVAYPASKDEGVTIEGSHTYADWTIHVDYDNGQGVTETTSALVNGDGNVTTADKETLQKLSGPVYDGSGNQTGGDLVWENVSTSAHTLKVKYTITNKAETIDRWGTYISKVTATASSAIPDAIVNITNESADKTSGVVEVSNLDYHDDWNNVVNLHVDYSNDGTIIPNQSFDTIYGDKKPQLRPNTGEPKLKSTSFTTTSQNTATINFEYDLPIEKVPVTETDWGEFRGIITDVKLYEADGVTEVDPSTYTVTFDNETGSLGHIDLTGLNPDLTDGVTGTNTYNYTIDALYDSTDGVGYDPSVDATATIEPQWMSEIYGKRDAVTPVTPLNKAKDPVITVNVETDTSADTDGSIYESGGTGLVAGDGIYDLDDDAADPFIDQDAAVILTYKIEGSIGDATTADTILNDDWYLHGTGIDKAYSDGTTAHYSNNDLAAGDAKVDSDALKLVADGNEHKIILWELMPFTHIEDWYITGTYHTNQGLEGNVDDVDTTYDESKGIRYNFDDPSTTVDEITYIDDFLTKSDPLTDGMVSLTPSGVVKTGTDTSLNYKMGWSIKLPHEAGESPPVIRSLKIHLYNVDGTEIKNDLYPTLDSYFELTDADWTTTDYQISMTAEDMEAAALTFNNLDWDTQYLLKFEVTDANFLTSGKTAWFGSEVVSIEGGTDDTKLDIGDLEDFDNITYLTLNTMKHMTPDSGVFGNKDEVVVSDISTTYKTYAGHYEITKPKEETYVDGSPMYDIADETSVLSTVYLYSKGDDKLVYSIEDLEGWSNDFSFGNPSNETDPNKPLYSDKDYYVVVETTYCGDVENTLINTIDSDGEASIERTKNETKILDNEFTVLDKPTKEGTIQVQIKWNGNDESIFSDTEALDLTWGGPGGNQLDISYVGFEKIERSAKADGIEDSLVTYTISGLEKGVKYNDIYFYAPTQYGDDYQRSPQYEWIKTNLEFAIPTFPVWAIILLVILLLLIIALIILLILFFLLGKLKVAKVLEVNNNEATFSLNKKGDKVVDSIKGRQLNTLEVKNLSWSYKISDNGEILITVKGYGTNTSLNELVFVANNEEAEKHNSSAIEKYENEMTIWTDASAKAKEEGKEFAQEKPAKPEFIEIMKDTVVAGTVSLIEVVKEEKPTTTEKVENE